MPAIIPSKQRLDVTNAQTAAKSEYVLHMLTKQRNIWSVRNTLTIGTK